MKMPKETKAFLTRNAIRKAMDNCEKACKANNPIYFEPLQIVAVGSPLLKTPSARATNKYKIVTRAVNNKTSMNLLAINCFLLQPSIIFCLWVLYVYSLVMNIITTTDGIKIKREEAYATVCHTSGKVNGLPTSIFTICAVVSPLLITCW